MEGWVKCLSPQNTFGISGVNSVSARVTSSSDEIKQQQLLDLKVGGLILKSLCESLRLWNTEQDSCAGSVC